MRLIFKEKETQMEGVGEFAMFMLMVGLVVGLLNIILFFKIWAMTNNVDKIKILLEEWLDLEHPVVESGSAKSKNEPTK